MLLVQHFCDGNKIITERNIVVVHGLKLCSTHHTSSVAMKPVHCLCKVAKLIQKHTLNLVNTLIEYTDTCTSNTNISAGESTTHDTGCGLRDQYSNLANGSILWCSKEIH